MISKRNWRRATRTGALGNTEAVPDSWVLVENYGQHEGRIALQKSGPNRGKWHWEVLLDRDGEARRLDGVCATGSEAKQAVEALVPEVIVQTEKELEIESYWVKRGYENLAQFKKRK
jgi:hypothetical protein